MPTEDQLEYEISLARHDLEANLAELRMVVRERLDVRRWARMVALTAGAVVAVVFGFWFSRRRAA